MRKFGLLVLLSLVSLVLFASSLLADHVTLKNGDRLTGSIVRSDDKSLVMIPVETGRPRPVFPWSRSCWRTHRLTD